MLDTNYYTLHVYGTPKIHEEFWKNGNYFDEREECFHFGDKIIYCNNLDRIRHHSALFESDEIISFEDIERLVNTLPDAESLSIRLFFCCPDNGTCGIWDIKEGKIVFKVEGYLDSLLNHDIVECELFKEPDEDVLYILMNLLFHKLHGAEPEKKLPF